MTMTTMVKKIGKNSYLNNNARDFTGQKFGKLTVICPTDNRSSGRIVWKCLCDCGNYHYVDWQSLIDGMTSHCPNCPRSYRKENGVAIRNTIYGEYKKGALRRNYSFTITIDEFTEITSSNCYYCGAPPSRVRTARQLYGSYVYNGIDRVDNTEGYIQGNCVPCCFQCNKAKGTMTQKEFLTWIRNIYNKQEVTDGNIERKDDSNDSGNSSSVGQSEGRWPADGESATCEHG